MQIKDLSFVARNLCCGRHEVATFSTADGSKVDVYRDGREDGAPDNYDMHVVAAGGAIIRHLLLGEEGAAEVLATMAPAP